MLSIKEQTQKLECDPTLRELAGHPFPVLFGGCPYAKETERRQTFLNNCLVARRVHLVIPQNGFNFDLPLLGTQESGEEVSFESVISIDGVAVKWSVVINKDSLSGLARLDFDLQTAINQSSQMSGGYAKELPEAIRQKITDIENAITHNSDNHNIM